VNSMDRLALAMGNERAGQLPRRSTAALNRRAKLVEEAQAAGDRVIEAAQAWVVEWARREYTRQAPTDGETALLAAVADLNARVAKVESAR
jgi:hypothetical protein